MTGPQYPTSPPLVHTLESLVNAITDALEKLDTLGNGRAIAEYFEREGIKGARGVSTDCPVAHYIRRETGAEVGIGTTFWVMPNLDMSVQMTPKNFTPVHVACFVSAFDDGLYRELELGVRLPDLGVLIHDLNDLNVEATK